jgi:hypothetical protein
MTDKDDEIKQRCQAIRAELLEWIEGHMEDFLALLGGPAPELPIIEDFRLLLCVTDGANPEIACYYPIVSSGTSYHRQLGLIDQGREYLTEYFGDDSE